MKNLVSLMHVSLDGFVAGPNGEMDWIQFDDAMFANVDKLHPHHDTALYGRNTFNMMEAYWPTADEDPNTDPHTKNHANWYRKVQKLVVSHKQLSEDPKTKVISIEQLQEEKQQSGSNILLLGSPSVVHQAAHLIDEYWLYINPVILGAGIPMFRDIAEKVKLTLIESIPFKAGVVAVHYKKA